MSDSVSKLVVFDCDSTLSAIEGVDEMAALRGPDIFKACEQMTLDAMEGKIPIASVFSERLKRIQPTREEVAGIGRHYIETIEPFAETCISELKKNGWGVAIVSGGFLQAIEPLAARLGIRRVAAVSLFFAEDGSYAGFDETAPTTRNGGKPEILKKWREQFSLQTIVMVGDGSSDLETKGTADLFVGFGRYIRRPRVEEKADAFILSLEELPDCLKCF
jgi:phosphoserine phosphatase